MSAKVGPDSAIELGQEERLNLEKTARSQSASVLARCRTHWSDGAETQALGRALRRSRHLRLHPALLHNPAGVASDRG